MQSKRRYERYEGRHQNVAAKIVSERVCVCACVNGVGSGEIFFSNNNCYYYYHYYYYNPSPCAEVIIVIINSSQCVRMCDARELNRVRLFASLFIQLHGDRYQFNHIQHIGHVVFYSQWIHQCVCSACELLPLEHCKLNCLNE